MASRHSLIVLSFLCAAVAVAPPAQAQRSGFIIGIGAGVGMASWTATSPFAVGSSPRQSRTGVATDFKLGSTIGSSFQLYYMNKVIFLALDNVDLAATGMSGLGFTLTPGSSPNFYINGGVGIHVWSEFDFDSGTNASLTGLGLLAGVGYHLSELWMLDFDIIYGKPGDDALTLNILGAKLTLNILSR
jgi:hypothetical protein